MKFFKPYDPPKTQFVSSGVDEVIDYIEDFDNETGERYLKAVGKHSQFDYIQAAAPGLDIYSMIEAHRINPEYHDYLIEDKINDFTEVPKDLMSAQDVLMNADRVFNRLPVEVRKDFDNNVNTFIAGISNGRTVQTLGKYYQKQPVPMDQTRVKEVVEGDK